MTPIVSEEWAGPDGAGQEPVDPLRRVVHVALAIYLLPVVAIVCAIGGAAIALDHAGRLAARVAAERRRPAWPGPHAPARPAGTGSAHRVPAGPRARAGR